MWDLGLQTAASVLQPLPVLNAESTVRTNRVQAGSRHFWATLAGISDSLALSVKIPWRPWLSFSSNEEISARWARYDPAPSSTATMPRTKIFRGYRGGIVKVMYLGKILSGKIDIGTHPMTAWWGKAYKWDSFNFRDFSFVQLEALTNISPVSVHTYYILHELKSSKGRKNFDCRRTEPVTLLQCSLLESIIYLPRV